MTQRTTQQNKAWRKYERLLAKALNDAGKDMHIVPETIEIPWNGEMIHDLVTLNVVQNHFRKTSTTELDTVEITELYDIVNRWSAKHGIHVPFPSEEEHGHNS